MDISENYPIKEENVNSFGLFEEVHDDANSQMETMIDQVKMEYFLEEPKVECGMQQFNEDADDGDANKQFYNEVYEIYEFENEEDYQKHQQQNEMVDMELAEEGNDGLMNNDDNSDGDNSQLAEDKSEDENDYIVALSSGRKYGEHEMHLSKNNLVSGSTCQRIIHNRGVCEKYIVRICPICGTEYENYAAWRQHLNAEHQLGKREHLNMEYFNAKKAKCTQCDVVLNSKNFSTLLLHEIKHLPYSNFLKCRICNKLTSHTMSMNLHLNRTHARELLEHARHSKTCCPFCDKIFDNYRLMQSHMINIHHKLNNAKIIFVCPNCNIEFKNDESELRRHLGYDHDYTTFDKLNFDVITNENSSVTKYQCRECSALYIHMNWIVLREHAMKHITAMQCFKCKYCARMFSSRLSIRYHVCDELRSTLKDIPKAAIDDVNSTTGDSLNSRPSKCSKCGEEFILKEQLSKHNCSVDTLITTTASSSSSANENNDHKVTAKFQEFEQLVKHICPACNVEFENIKEWHSHLNTMHKLHTLHGVRMVQVEENKVKCLDCNVLMKNVAVIRLRHRFHHLPYKPYKCRYCGDGLDKYETVYSHARKCQCQTVAEIGANCNELNQEVTAEELIKFICPLCPELEFNRFSQLNAHFRIGHKSFEDSFVMHTNGSMSCKQCEKSFIDSDIRRMVKHHLFHVAIHPYHCRQCSHVMMDFQKMKQHVRIVHLHQMDSVASATANVETTVNTATTSSNSNKTLPKISKARMAYCSEKSPVLNQYNDYITYACPECNEALPTQNEWHVHINAKHDFFDEQQMNIEILSDGTKRCKECDVRITGGNLHEQRHKLTHMPYRSFICALCYHRANTLGVLFQHIRRRHFTPGIFKCVLCPLILNTSYEQCEHIKTHNPKEWPDTICRICFRNLSSRSSLAAHMETHEAERRRYKCEFCDRQFLSSSENRRHQLRNHHLDEANLK